MCGRFVITSPPAALRQIFGYVEQPNFPPRHNIAPTQPIPVVMLENGGRHFRLMRWGLVPAWVKDPRKFSLLINARAETVLEKPAFKNAIKRRRCLDGRANDADAVMPLLIGPAEGEFAWHEISTRVNRVANDDPQLLLPITDEERAAEEPKPKKIAACKASPIASDDEGQGSLF